MSPPARSLVLAALLVVAACGGRSSRAPSISTEDASEPSVVPSDSDDAGDEEPEVDSEDDSGAPEHDAGDGTGDADGPPTTQPDAGSEPATRDAEIADASDTTQDAAVQADASLDDAGQGMDAATDAGADAQADDAGLDGSNAEAGLDAGNDASVDASVERDAAGDWSCFGKDLAHTRFNAAETTLSAANVANLQLAWQRPAPGISATPAVVGDSVYWADWQGTVQAARISDGATRWSRAFGHGFTSSPCVTQSSVFIGDRFNTLYALDLSTGATRWATPINSVTLTHLWSSPIVADGVVVVGISADGTNADREPLPPEVINTFRGAVVGVDAQSGAILWRFETTRVPGQDPNRYGPGVSVWSSGAVDTTRGLVFIGTGNAYAQPASPYSDALLALRIRTGELAWHVQFTPNDAYSGANPGGGPDYDIGAAPNLFTIQSAGAARDVVGVGDKGGRYRVFDRATGALVWERQLEPGFNISGRKTGGIIAPAAIAYGRVYVASNTSWRASRVWALNANNGEIVWTSETNDSVNFGGPAVANGVVFFGGSGFRVDEDLPDSIGVGSPGRLIAYAADTGAVLYSTDLFAGRGAGFSISQGHVFVGTGFTFYGYSDEPVDGALQAFHVP